MNNKNKDNWFFRFDEELASCSKLLYPRTPQVPVLKIDSKIYMGCHEKIKTFFLSDFFKLRDF